MEMNSNLRNLKLFNKMFRKNAQKEFTDLISKSCVINGSIGIAGYLHVDGLINGDSIHSQSTEPSTLFLSKISSVSVSNINCTNVVIDGPVTCNEIRCSELKILSNAFIKDCTIYYNNISIEHGAQLDNCKFMALLHQQND